METRANYMLIGAFTLAVVIGVFGFVYWFQNIGGTGERAIYQVRFDGSVSGLRTGGSVMFNGIRVGEVTGLTLNEDRPHEVTATISIDKKVVVRADTEASLEFQGLTGIAALSLKGGSPSSPALEGDKANPPLLIAPPGATQDVMQAARDALRRVDDLIAENQKTFHSALENIDKFTNALARNSERIDSTLNNIDKFSSALGRNSDRIDKIAEGLQNLTGGADGKGGQINDAATSMRRLSDTLTSDAHRTLGTIDRAVKNLDANPSRLIWGGPPPTPAPTPTPQRKRR
jgi:phospholipid/cholesterol/gamma-HCH transport system substrate-binding protein